VVVALGVVASIGGGDWRKKTPGRYAKGAQWHSGPGALAGQFKKENETKIRNGLGCEGGNGSK
jgi:hypothetical protein